MQIPQALTSILQHRGIKIALINNDGYFHEAIIYFYDKNPVGRGLECKEFPSQKANFLMHVVQLNCVNPVRDITKCPLPPLDKIAQDIHIKLQDVIQKGTLSRKDLDAVISTE